MNVVGGKLIVFYTADTKSAGDEGAVSGTESVPSVMYPHYCLISVSYFSQISNIKQLFRL